MPTKRTRAIARITKAQRIYADGVGIEPRAFVVDLLVDLHHYCESHGLNIQHISDMANRVYSTESNS